MFAPLSVQQFLPGVLPENHHGFIGEEIYIYAYREQKERILMTGKPN